jgi:hypothetical protein
MQGQLVLLSKARPLDFSVQRLSKARQLELSVQRLSKARALDFSVQRLSKAWQLELLSWCTSCHSEPDVTERANPPEIRQVQERNHYRPEGRFHRERFPKYHLQLLLYWYRGR